MVWARCTTSINHVVQEGSGIKMVYDGDGNHVKKTVAGVTTTYLVDTQNPKVQRRGRF